MTKPGNNLTEDIWEKVEINKQQYEDILFYGCITPFETLLIKFFRIVVPRTNEVELLKFEDIDFDRNECTLYAKWIRPKTISKATQEEKKEHEAYVEDLIKKKLKKGELIKIKYRGSHELKGKPIYKQKQLAEFNDEVKKLLLDHKYDIGEGFVFKKNKSQKYSITGKAMLETLHRVIVRTNKRLEEEGKRERIIRHPGGQNEQFRLHDLGRHSLAKKVKKHPELLLPLAKKLRHSPDTLVKRYGKPTVSDYKEIYRELENE